jgi:DNA-binding LytR/AlgR family response regulator
MKYKSIAKTVIITNFTEVLYLAADINYTTIYYKNGAYHVVPYTLRRFEEHLAPYQNFVRIHRAFIINKNYVADASPTEVMLSTGLWLPVARRRVGSMKN